MLRLLLAVAALLYSISASAGLGGGLPGSAGIVFTPLHTYNMAATGCSDSYNGLSPTFTSGSTGPWCDSAGPATSSTTMDCGDVILAWPGTYNGYFNSWSGASNCPSTSGGIDGTGGIYAYKVFCVALDQCIINCATGECAAESGTNTNAAAINVTASHVIVEGFKIVGTGQVYGMVAAACATGTTQLQYIGFIDNEISGVGSGVLSTDCAINHNVPGNGVDEFAAVGNIIQKGNQADVCTGALVVLGASVADTNAGTHIYLAGNFLIANNIVGTASTCTNSDIEGILLDTHNAHGYTQQEDIENNLVWASSMAGLQVFQQAFNSSALTMDIHHNTFVDDYACSPSYFEPGEMNFQIDGGFPWTYNVYANIATNSHASAGWLSGCNTTSYPTSSVIYAFHIGSAAGSSGPTINIPGSNPANIFSGASGQNIALFNGFTIGTNTVTSPAFTNLTDLLTNWVGVPNCTGYANNAACMGWNYSTQSATALTPIADTIPTAGGASSDGYQPPAPPTANALYPTWLKGMVYWRISGGVITEWPDLITRPANL